MTDLIDKLIGPYRPKAEIGRGPVALVYRAFDTVYDREVALKVLPPYFAHDPAVVRRFISVGREASRLRHPNILPVYEAGHADGVNFVAMELVAGGTLADRLGANGASLALDDVLVIIQQVSAGLDYAHARNHLHLNLKPSNIFFAADGHAQLADFGSVFAASPASGTDAMPGASPAFLAPEQASGAADLDDRTDIYALGAVTYMMLSGRAPFDADNPIVLLRKILDEEAPRLGTLNPELPAHVESAVHAALSKDRSVRPPSGAAFCRLVAESGDSVVYQPTIESATVGSESKQSASPEAASTQTSAPAPMRSDQRPATWHWIWTAAIVVGIALVLIAVLNSSEVLQERLGNGLETPREAIAVLPTAVATIAATETATMPAPSPTAEIAPTTQPASVATGVPRVVIVAPGTPTASSAATGQSDAPQLDITPAGSEAQSQAESTSGVALVTLAPYSDTRLGVRLNAPVDWQAQEQPNGVVFTSDDGSVQLTLAPLTLLTTDVSLRAIADQAIASRLNGRQVSPAVESLTRGEGDIRRIGPVRAYEEWLTGVVDGEDVVIRLTVTMAQEQAFALITLIDPAHVNAVRPILDAVIDSFSLDGEAVAALASTATTIPTEAELPVATATATPSETPQATATVETTPTPTATQASPGVVADFEEWGTWLRGDESWGDFTQSKDEVHGGEFAGKFDYAFPANAPEGRNFIVFRRTLPIGVSSSGAEPNALRLWVYGDGSGSYLNAWVQDADRKLWQFSFGQVSHSSWQQMTAPFDLARGWPNQLIGSEQTDGSPSFPIRLHALVVDGYPEDVAHQGTIYVDDLSVETLDAAALALGPTQTISATVEVVAPPTATPARAGRIAYAKHNASSDRMDLFIYTIESDLSWPQIPNRRQPDFGSTGELVVNGEGGDVDNLVRMGPNGENPWVISEHPEDSHPQWSPSGKMIVFDSTFVGDGRHRIYLQDDASDRRPVRPMMFDAWELFGRYPVFLSDGRIGYSGCNVWENGGTCGVYVVDTAGGQPTRVTDYPRDIPTDNLGAQILVMSDREGSWDIYLANADGSDLRQLTSGPANDGLATASPDGAYIAFVTDRDERWSVYVMASDGSNLTRLFDLDGGYGSGHQAWTEERLSWGP